MRRSPSPRGGHRKGWAIGASVVLLLALGFGARLAQRAGHRSSSAAPGAAPLRALPDPDTGPMTPPVARAIREAREAALASPDSAVAVGTLGEVLQAHWLYEEAAACYEIARELAPGEFRWVYLLAGVEEIRGVDAERVEDLFRQAIRLAPGHAPAYVRLADALMRLGRWQEAADVYDRAAALDSELVLALRGRGQAANLMGEGPEAVKHLERARELAPDDRITHTALARAYSLAGRTDEAAEASRRAQTLTSEARLPDQIFFEMQNRAVDPESLRSRAIRRLGQGAVDAALRDLALLAESEGPGARQQLARSSKQRANQLAYAGEFDRALLEFERASLLGPGDPEVEHNWGTVLLRQGKLGEAARHFERALEANPRSADSLYNLGVTLEGLGRTREAMARFRAAVAIDPEHLAARRLAELGAATDR